MKKELKKILNSLKEVETNLLRLQTIQLTIELSSINMESETLLNSYIDEYANNFDNDNNDLYIIAMSTNDSDYKLNLMIKYYVQEKRRLERKIVYIVNEKLQ